MLFWSCRTERKTRWRTASTSFGTLSETLGAIGDIQERVEVNGKCAALIDAVEKHVGRDDWWQASNDAKRAMISEMKRRTGGD